MKNVLIQRIKEELRQKKINQTKAAEFCGISRVSLSLQLSEKRRLTFHSFVTLCSLLNLEIELKQSLLNPSLCNTITLKKGVDHGKEGQG